VRRSRGATTMAPDGQSPDAAVRAAVPSDVAILHQAAARCLAYPDAAFLAELPLLAAALADVRHGAAVPLRTFVADAASRTGADLTQRYVETFDFTNRHSLYLSWWTDGDTRRRGQALVRFKEVYRTHGLDFGDGELPDFLPAVLEFSALTGSDALLVEHRPALELLRHALADHASPYAQVLATVCATLPGPSPKDHAEARAMARSGPPREDVGLEPYGLEPYRHLGLLPILTGDR
jgi:nitrate reductase delta subunit